MSAPPIKVWTINPAVITLLIVIASIIASAGYYIGHQAAVIENIQKQADDAKTAAQTAKDVVYAGTSTESPTPTPKTKEKK